MRSANRMPMQVGKWVVMPALKGAEYDLSQAQLLGGGVNDGGDSDGDGDNEAEYDDETRIEVTNGSEIFLQQDLFHLARQKQRKATAGGATVNTEIVSSSSQNYPRITALIC